MLIYKNYISFLRNALNFRSNSIVHISVLSAIICRSKLLLLLTPCRCILQFFFTVSILFIFFSPGWAQERYLQTENGIPSFPVLTNTAEIASPLTGMMIYSEQDNFIMIFNGSEWRELGENSNMEPLTGTLATSFSIVDGIPVFPFGIGLKAENGHVYYSTATHAFMIYNNGETFLTKDGGISSSGTQQASFEVSGGGFKLPILTDATGISSLQKGMLFYNNTTKTSVVYNGSSWEKPPPAPPFSCGSSLTVTHNPAGGVAAKNVTISYGTVSSSLSGEPKCWITQNLGATTQASSAADASDAAAGWCWQFNRKQGYAYPSEGSRTPNTAWDSSREEGPDWEAANDPCTQLLGAGWRIPTQTEWTNARSNWSNYSVAFSSVLKLHAAGGLSPTDGSLRNRGTSGVYWTSSQISTNGYTLTISYSSSSVGQSWKSDGISVRCLFDL